MTGQIMKFKVLGWVILTLLLSSCAFSPNQNNRYQFKMVSSKSVSGPVAELQQKALNALAAENARESIEYLERAIKIEPRNAYSWHYLAQSYWQDKNYKKCLAMLERSLSYSIPADDLDNANQSLKQQCLGG